VLSLSASRGPDYLAGVEEFASKLILYNIVRSVRFKLKPGLRFFLFLHYMDPHDPYFEHPYDGTAITRVAAPRKAKPSRPAPTSR